MTDFERGKVEGLMTAIEIVETYGNVLPSFLVRRMSDRIEEIENAESTRARMGSKGELR